MNIDSMCPYRHHCFEKVDPRETEEINYVSRLYEILGMLVWHEMKGNLILELAHLGILIRKKDYMRQKENVHCHFDINVELMWIFRLEYIFSMY